MAYACKHAHKSLEIQTDLLKPICTAENNHKKYDQHYHTMWRATPNHMFSVITSSLVL